ncbi:helix-turn-helix domain-containing protein [Citricoccus nitrophenolicus]|uniref:helix-turn-helix domain-containing protein n=1 Tax=Citricoccus nitrophenolicus TaxID=863575 RepID=UPI0031EF85AE
MITFKPYLGPRPHVPLPKDPEALAYVQWRRLRNEAHRVLDDLIASGVTFLSNGAPPSEGSMVPEGSTPLQAASWRSGAWAIWAPGHSPGDGLSLGEAWEQSLVKIIERNPRFGWHTVVTYLTAERPKRPATVIQGERDLPWEEELVLLTRLVADAKAYGDTDSVKHARFLLRDLHAYLEDVGLDWEPVLAAESMESLSAVPLTTENLPRLVERRDYWAKQAMSVARDLLLWDPIPNPFNSDEFRLLWKPCSIYTQAIARLTANPEAEVAESDEPVASIEAEERPVEPVSTLGRAMQAVSTVGQPEPSEPPMNPTEPEETAAARVSPLEAAATITVALSKHPAAIEELDEPVESKREHAFLTVPEVAEELRVHPHTVRGYLRSESLPSVKMGGVYRIARTALDEWIATGGKPREEPKPLLLDDDIDYGF